MIKCRKKCGISLMEVMMTVVIASVLITTGYVTFGASTQMQSAKAGAERVGYAIKKAKYFSRTKGIITKFNIPVGGNGFSITAEGQSMTNQSYVDAMSGIFSGDVIITANTCPELSFDVDGTLIDNTGDGFYSYCSITVGYAGGPQQRLVLKGKSGNVEYE